MVKCVELGKKWDSAYHFATVEPDSMFTLVVYFSSSDLAYLDLVVWFPNATLASFRLVWAASVAQVVEFLALNSVEAEMMNGVGVLELLVVVWDLLMVDSAALMGLVKACMFLTLSAKSWFSAGRPGVTLIVSSFSVWGLRVGGLGVGGRGVGEGEFLNREVPLLHPPLSDQCAFPRVCHLGEEADLSHGAQDLGVADDIAPFGPEKG